MSDDKLTFTWQSDNPEDTDRAAYLESLMKSEGFRVVYDGNVGDIVKVTIFGVAGLFVIKGADPDGTVNFEWIAWVDNE